MKGMRGSRFLRKMKLIPTISNFKQGLVLHLNPQEDVFCIQKVPSPPIHGFDDHKGNNQKGTEEYDKNFEEEEMELEEATPTVESKETEQAEEKLVTLAPMLSKTTNIMELNRAQQVQCSNELYPYLADFNEICPPGGTNSIILYTTSLRGIRKTFQDCNSIRFLLRSFKILYHERDVSLHLEYREELRKILGCKVIPPKLFINGRYIGGADQVVGLHERGWLGKLLEGTPIEFTDSPCNGCANVGFSICSNCSGSCKVFKSNDGDKKDEFMFIRCPECNENGLVKCPICS